MRILILGAGGMVGQALVECAAARGHIAEAAARSDLDIRRHNEVVRRARDFRPDWIINAAAYTRVDDCETDRDTAQEVNGTAVVGLAAAASEIDARLLQISTDYVFDGRSREPYQEDAATGPESVYGQTKLAGERAALVSERNLVVRTSWLFGPGGANFVRTIVGLANEREELAVVADQRGAPTYSRFLARALLELAERGACGVFHYRNREPVTWFEFASAVVGLAGASCRIVETTTEAYPRPAPRPAYSVLSVDRFEATVGRVVEPWLEGLQDYLQKDPRPAIAEEA